jgi:hypothetical protein
MRRRSRSILSPLVLGTALLLASHPAGAIAMITSLSWGDPIVETGVTEDTVENDLFFEVEIEIEALLQGLQTLPVGYALDLELTGTVSTLSVAAAGFSMAGSTLDLMLAIPEESCTANGTVTCSGNVFVNFVQPIGMATGMFSAVAQVCNGTCSAPLDAQFTVPEPQPLALLAIAGLVLLTPLSRKRAIVRSRAS